MRIPFENGLVLDFDLIKEWDDISSFNCRDEDLNDFLRTDALKNQQSRLSITWLVRWNGNLVGFCTLINDSIKTRWINPGDGEHGYRYLHYPALKIARLATRQDFERRGIGTAMLDYATAVAIKLSDEISGCRILTVDSKNDSIEFYQSFGFKLANTETIGDTVPLYKDIYGTRAE
jgi:GNAT superfamily N-acetyltransferase